MLKGTTTETRLRFVLQQSLVNASIVTFDQASEGMAMLDASTIDAYAGDKVKLVGLVAQTKDSARYQMLSEGGYAGNKIAENSQQLVWIIDVRYDDGTIATIQQRSAPGLRIGDRVLSDRGIQLLR